MACTVLVHSSGRAESRVFWAEILFAVDRHFPLSVCSFSWYFSYDGPPRELDNITKQLTHAPRLIHRPVQKGWVGAMRHDLSSIHERWIFHLMDDTSIPDLIPASTIRALVEAAKHLNASTIAINAFLHKGFWQRAGNAAVLLPRTVLPGPLEAAMPGIRMWRASIVPRTRFVMQQNFALWERDALYWSLSPFKEGANPANWEMGWNNWKYVSGLLKKSKLALSLDRELRERAHVLEFVRPHVLQGVYDVGHHGLIKSAWCACSWLRMLTRLGMIQYAAGHSRHALGLQGKVLLLPNAPNLSDGRDGTPRCQQIHTHQPRSVYVLISGLYHDSAATPPRHR